jgi:hypothetical protein
MELELSDEWAADLLRKFIAEPAETFPIHALGYLLATVDFRQVESVTRAHRAPRLGWWADFVGKAEKVKTLTKTGEKSDWKPLPIGAADEWCKRNRRTILRIQHALGPDYMLKRAAYWSRQRGELELMGDKLQLEQDRQAVESLRVYRHSGLCGTADDLPI